MGEAAKKSALVEQQRKPAGMRLFGDVLKTFQSRRRHFGLGQRLERHRRRQPQLERFFETTITPYRTGENVIAIRRSLKSWGFPATTTAPKAEKCPILMTFTPIANAAGIAGFLGVAELRRTGYPASRIVTRNCRQRRIIRLAEAEPLRAAELGTGAPRRRST